MTQKTTQNPWQFDVRVRERNLKQGSLTDKELDKHLAGLPDLADHVESFGTSQPALEQPRVAPAPVHAITSAPASEDDLDDEEDEDDDDDVDVGEEPVAAAPAPVLSPVNAADEPPATPEAAPESDAEADAERTDGASGS